MRRGNKAGRRARCAGIEGLERRVLLAVAPVGAEIRANTTTDFDQNDPAIAVRADGSFVIVWEGDSPIDSDDIYFQRFDTLGQPVGAETRVNTMVEFDQRDPAVAMDGAGNFVVVWESWKADGSRDNVMARRFDAMGQALSEEFQVNTWTGRDQNDAAVGMTVKGDFVIVWKSERQDGSGDGVYAQRYDTAGEAVGDEFCVNVTTAGTQGNPSVAMDDWGGFVVAWESSAMSWMSIVAQRFDARGNRVGGEIVVDRGDGHYSRLPALGIGTNGDWVVAWRQSGLDLQGEPFEAVYARFLDSGGNAAGAAVQVGMTVGDGEPAVAIDDAGKAIVTWHDESAAMGKHVYGRRVERSGSVMGEIFPVSSFEGSGQIKPAVGVTPMGAFVVTWQSSGQDGSMDGTYAQRFAPVSVGQPAAVGGRVWFDAVPDGVLSEMEGRAGDVVVSLYNADGAIVARRLTNSVGEYRFTGLYPGMYRIGFEAPGSYVFTDQHVGDDPLIDSDADPVSGKTALFELAAGQTDFSRCAGLYHEGILSGVVYDDRDVDRQRDVEEVTLPGRIVFLDGNGNGRLDAGERTAATDATGRYRFEGLRPGAYAVAVDNYYSWIPSAPQTSHNVTLTAGQYSAGLDFGVYSRISPLRFYRVSEEWRTPVTTSPGSAVYAADPLGVHFAVGHGFDKLGGAEVHIQIFYTNGLPKSFDVTVANVPLSSFQGLELAMNRKGELLVVYTLADASGSTVYGRRYNPSGSPQTEAVVLATGPVGIGTVLGATLLDAGVFVLGYSGPNRASLLTRRFDRDLLPLGVATEFNTTAIGSVASVDVASGQNGQFVVAWAGWGAQGIGVFAQQFKSGGSASGAEIQLGRDYDTNLAVAMNQRGEWVAGWAVKGKMEVQRFDAYGLPRGTVVQVESPAPYSELYIPWGTVAIDDQGEYMVSWQVRGGEGWLGSQIFAQRFNTAGQREGQALHVGTAATFARLGPVAMDPDGRFTVLWHDMEADWSTFSLLGRKYDGGRGDNKPQIIGTAEAEAYTIRLTGSYTTLYDAQNGIVASYSYSMNYPLVMTVKLLGGDDSLTVDLINGSPLPPSSHGSFVLEGGEGVDSLLFVNTKATDEVTVESGRVMQHDIRLSSTITFPAAHTGVESVGLTGSGEEMVLGYLIVKGTAKASVVGPAGITLRVASLRLEAAATLDLRDSRLVVTRAAGPWPGVTVAGMEAYIWSARRNGTWDGPGVMSSSYTRWTTLGAFAQGDGSILVRLVYYGDLNGDGVVNLNDYFVMDASYLNQGGMAVGFAQGDVNLDGEINLNDYFLVDSAYLNQGNGGTGAMASVRGEKVFSKKRVKATKRRSDEATKGRRRR